MHRFHLLVSILAFLIVLHAQTEEPTPIPITEAPTEAPATDSPTTEAPLTEPPVTEAPVTEAPITQAPVTQAPVTEAPITQAPVTEAPVTEAPITEAPITEAPITDAPTTEAPVTEVPSTAPPTEGPPPPPVVSTPMPSTDLLAPLEETITGSSHKNGLDSSQIAGICMGLVFGLAIIVLSILFAIRVRKARQADLNGMFGLTDSIYSDESPLPAGKFQETRFIVPPTVERDSSIPVLSRSQRQSSVPSRTLSVHDEIPMAYGRLSSPGSRAASLSQWPSQESCTEEATDSSPTSLRRRSLAQSYATDYDYQMTDTSSFISIGESPNGAANWIAAMDTSDEVEGDEIVSRNSYEV